MVSDLSPSLTPLEGPSAHLGVISLLPSTPARKLVCLQSIVETPTGTQRKN